MPISTKTMPLALTGKGDFACRCDARRFDVGIQIFEQRMMHRHLMVLAALLMETEIRRSAYQQAIRCLIQGHPEQKDRVPLAQVQQC